MSRPLVFLALIFAALGAPLVLGWMNGEFEIFWTTPGAVLVQMYGSCAACLWAAWLFRRAR